ncbi:hypothetical protein [Natrinema marinum]|uniref:hypothetical protein n=1 Tax=Natrinema marinum TaxID=2961598 RepID=UPI0020C90D35|nr:hypothetical protein [Natrinema marinum]
MNAAIGRRRFLLATAGASALAGCSSSSTGDSPSNETAENPDATASVELEGLSATLQYVRPATDEGRPEVLATEGHQYVVAAFDAATVDASDVAFRLDGTEYTGSFTATRDGRLEIGFEVPRDVAAESGAVLVGGESNSVYRDVLDRLANPPRFTNVSFDADPEVRPGAFMGLDVRVWNKGGPGSFEGVFDVSGAPPKVFSEQVDSGTYASFMTYVTIDEDAGAGERTAVFDTGFEEYTVPFSIVDPESA